MAATSTIDSDKTNEDNNSGMNEVKYNDTRGDMTKHVISKFTKEEDMRNSD